jgi:transcriptional regulator NrdR family protein
MSGFPSVTACLKEILDNNSVFIRVILSKINLTLIKMNPKEILSKEISNKVGDKISEQTISEKVSQFVRHGNLFLLFEVMTLRKEIESLKEEIQHQRNNEKRKSVHALYIP